MAKKRAPRRTSRRTATAPVVMTSQTPSSESSTSRYPVFYLLALFILAFVLTTMFMRGGASQGGSIAQRISRVLGINTAAPTTMNPQTETNNTQPPGSAQLGSDYTVRAGDHLWKIAEEAYGSGYNAYDIASANHLTNPSAIEVGQHLILPKVEARSPTRGDIAANTPQAVTQTPSPASQAVERRGGTYVVQHGDCLWAIAQARYGDGNRWHAIAEANHLVNPRLIHAGNRLTIP